MGSGGDERGRQGNGAAPSTAGATICRQQAKPPGCRHKSCESRLPGPSTALALNADGEVVAWGKNSDGQTNVPPAATNIVAVAAGTAHSLALKDDGSVVAWGRDWDGQTDVPSTATNVVAVAAGWAHSLALRADGRWWRGATTITARPISPSSAWMSWLFLPATTTTWRCGRMGQ